MAGKDNLNESVVDKTSFFWVGLCGICHPGGGPGEFDRDGLPYFDDALGSFGYEHLGKTAQQVTLDGDYAVVNHMNGQISPAAWDKTGVAEPDCMMCHRSDTAFVNGKNMNWVWRTATLRGREGLVDSQGGPVRAYLASSTAGQGWFSDLQMSPQPPGKPPKAASLDIDYGVGLANGSLVLDGNSDVALDGGTITKRPRDVACWGCHVTPDLKKRGMVWFSAPNDVHYAGFNNLSDADPTNDIPPELSVACTKCHPSGLNHEIAKGNAFLGSVRNGSDYVGMKTCRGCHLPGNQQDPAAPQPTSTIHAGHHLQVMSCEFCHIPSLGNAAQLVVDNSVTGSTIGYNTDAFLSADPLDPLNPDRSVWYPGARMKTAEDGVNRLYPVKPLLSAWWGDWDDNGTPGYLGDDVVSPVILWRLRQVTGGNPLPVVTDDNGDGKPEVNREAEIFDYLQALKGVDSYGRMIAQRPVLVRGGRVWYEDPLSMSGVSSLSYHGTGMHVESGHPFSIDHNVLPRTQALGAMSCGECHSILNGGADTPVFDRLILVDPFDTAGVPQYERLRNLVGIHPF